METKPKNQCQFCKSRMCRNKIYRHKEPKYDEVYCDKHRNEAEKSCDETLGKGNGVFRIYMSSTGNLSRGSI